MLLKLIQKLEPMENKPTISVHRPKIKQENRLPLTRCILSKSYTPLNHMDDCYLNLHLVDSTIKIPLGRIYDLSSSASSG